MLTVHTQVQKHSFHALINDSTGFMPKEYQFYPKYLWVLCVMDGMYKDAYFDVRLFHPNAPSYRSMDLPAVYHRHESEEKIQRVEHGVCTPLVFSTTGGMACECSIFYRRLADMISIKQDKPYSLVVSWLRTGLSYASLLAAVLCISGSRSSHHHPIYEHDLTFATVEGKIPSSV